jgi:hypothetical protein
MRLPLSIFHPKNDSKMSFKNLDTLNLCKRYLRDDMLLEKALKSSFSGQPIMKNQATKESIIKCELFVKQHEEAERLKEEELKKQLHEVKKNEIFRIHLLPRGQNSILKDFLTMRY